MQYHFSAVKPKDRRWSLITLLVVATLLVATGSVYFFSPRFARISVEPQRLSVAVGTSTSLTVAVENLSRETYSSERRVMLSGRYLGRDRDLAQLARVDLGELLPDERGTYEIDVPAPPQPGRYRLQLDLIREGSSWFADLGNPAPVVEVVVP